MEFWRIYVMKHGRNGMLILAASLFAFQAALAQETPKAADSDDAEVRKAYERTLADAERERAEAMAAVSKAREELERSAEERARASAEVEAARAEARQQQRLEREEAEAMRRELSRAQQELRQASREVVRMHRELERAQGRAPRAELIRTGSRAVIGVVLGGSVDTGVEVLGVSPDGPAERAGIQQGDVIVAVMDKRLASKDGAKAGQVLLEAMKGVKPGDELEVTVQREGAEQTITVTAEEREPVGWASMIRLPSAPHAPDAPVIVERIEVPHIDEELLAEKMEQLQRDLERKQIIIEKHGHQLEGIAPEVWEFEFDNLSELGEEVTSSANVWFGMPMARGLKLAAVNEQLGDYFKTNSGVLVLEARDDNDLQLEPGDVVVAVGGKKVERPVDLMRELRQLEPGAPLEIEIMRKRKNRTLDVKVPERKLGFAPEVKHEYHYRVEVKPD
jgi:C-terminal processing protease CtpA/Prc